MNLRDQISRGRLSLIVLLLGLSIINYQCKSEMTKEDKESEAGNYEPISKSDFGVTREGEKVELYTLKNGSGMSMDIITYGGIITSWNVPDKNGVLGDIVLGYNSLEEYQKGTTYFGALIGRYGNRIAKGKFSIDGTEYNLETNDGENHLHGGPKGFDKVVWTADTATTNNSASLILTHISPDLEEGYPGNLTATVTYTLTSDNTLDVLYEATTDKKTVVNLTQHTYFNLSAGYDSTILGQEVMIDADAYIPVNETLIPTGELESVENTPFDFREVKALGKDINETNDQLKKGGGFDHCWVLNNQNGEVRMVTTAYHKPSGRFLEVFTDEPGIQLYTGNFLDGTLPSKNGGVYAYRSGFCLETQHFPDSPNQKNFPSTELNVGEKYTSKTSFKFSTK